MSTNPTAGNESAPPTPPRYGPGLLMIFGLALVAVAAWCAWDLSAKEDWVKEGRTGTIMFNWAAMVAGVVGAIYCFILAAIRAARKSSAAAQGTSPAKE